MLRTLTPSPTTQSMPARIRAITFPPSITIALASIASGATPKAVERTLRPAIVPAVCVPCSSVSWAEAPGTGSPTRSNSAKCSIASLSAG